MILYPIKIYSFYTFETIVIGKAVESFDFVKFEPFVYAVAVGVTDSLADRLGHDMPTNHKRKMFADEITKVD